MNEKKVNLVKRTPKELKKIQLARESRNALISEDRVKMNPRKKDQIVEPNEDREQLMMQNDEDGASEHESDSEETSVSLPTKEVLGIKQV